jgi:hypothetical protein
MSAGETRAVDQKPLWGLASLAVCDLVTVNSRCNNVRYSDILDVAMTSCCTVLVHTQYNDILDVAIIAIILQSIW